eukprot:1234787-Amorphochlora_amoeboformis.AAC.1
MRTQGGIEEKRMRRGRDRRGKKREEGAIYRRGRKRERGEGGIYRRGRDREENEGGSECII